MIRNKNINIVLKHMCSVATSFQIAYVLVTSCTFVYVNSDQWFRVCSELGSE